MILFFWILIFILCAILLFWSSSWLVKALMRISDFLGWKEFVVAFFVMAIAGAAPNFFIGINSAIQKIPQLSFGDVIGGNLIDLSLAIALAVLIGNTAITTGSKVIIKSSMFTIVLALLPLFLILDGVLGRIDGILLISFFFFYVFWLFSKEERFKKVYEQDEKKDIKGFKDFMKNLCLVFGSLTALLLASYGIIESSLFFAEKLNFSIGLIGLLIVGVGNALPETYFAIASARQGKTKMILGNLMGSVIVSATLVLGIVALICPIRIDDFSPFAIARLFLIISVLFFIFFARTGKKITKKEGLFLLLIYVLFILAEILLT